MNGLFGDSIWDYVGDESEEELVEFVIKWALPREKGSGKIWSITSPDDLEFQIDVKEFHIEVPSYSKSGKIYARGRIIVMEDEAHIV